MPIPTRYFSVTPVFDNPSVEPDQKISLVRFLIGNKSASLKPGMMAYVNIKRNQKYTMVIPKSSILVGNMVTAWVKKGDGMYENRVIQLGIQNKKGSGGDRWPQGGRTGGNQWRLPVKQRIGAEEGHRHGGNEDVKASPNRQQQKESIAPALDFIAKENGDRQVRIICKQSLKPSTSVILL